MTDFEHTFIAIACIGVAFYLGRFIGRSFAHQEGFEEGVYSATNAIITELNKQYGMSFKANVEIEEPEED